MEDQLKQILKNLKLNENTISTILGGIVVIVIGAVIFNYLNKNRIPQVGQVTPEAATEQVTAPEISLTPEVKLTEEQGQLVPEGLPTTYTVKAGDDLWHISEKFYTSGYNWVDIAKTNNLKNGNVISAGQKLTIPKAAIKKVTHKTVLSQVKTDRPNAIEGTSYKTVKGDYLWKIAIRAYGDGFAWTRIYNANKALIGRNPSALEAGMALTIPR